MEAALSVAKLPQKLRILLIEDDDVVALYLTELLEESGIFVVGPVGRVAEALELIDRQTTTIDGAILDINLHGEFSYPVADALVRCDIPFLFTTGYGAGTLDAAYSSHPRCEKPFQEQALLGALARIVAAPAV
jgi:CheY-like chemotaxis protein